MVKAVTLVRMDMVNKAMCYVLRNPPKGHKKVALHVALSVRSVLSFVFLVVLLMHSESCFDFACISRFL